MSGIRLENVSKTFANGYEAVRAISLDIAEGEFLVLVGPSGCGKSTALRMIAGLEEPTAGRIYIGERLVNGVEPGDRDIAMVFQNYALYPHMTVRQNLSFGLRMRRTPKAQINERVAVAASALSIDQLLDRRPRELSGGQRQRVALGRALVRNPKAFLFDEPLSNLDAKLRVQMRTEIAQLHGRLGTTMVYVTHDQVEAMTLGDRIVVMRQGVVQQVDTPLNLYHAPCNRFVADFIGSPSMNFFRGRIADGRFTSQEFAFDLGGTAAPGEVILGIRPEHFLRADEHHRAFSVVRLDVVEQMGHETLVYFTIGGQQVVARIDAGLECRPGDRLPLAVDGGQVRVFAADGDERRLNH